MRVGREVAGGVWMCIERVEVVWVVGAVMSKIEGGV